LDPNSGAIVLSTKSLTMVAPNGSLVQQTIAVNSVIMFTDYDNIELRYACGTYETATGPKPHSYYFVLVRSRNFDSVKIFGIILDYLKTTGVSLNDLIFLYNRPDCIN
jgi:hypothetical protein